MEQVEQESKPTQKPIVRGLDAELAKLRAVVKKCHAAKLAFEDALEPRNARLWDTGYLAGIRAALEAVNEVMEPSPAEKRAG